MEELSKISSLNEKFTQAQSLLSGFKEIIEKQNLEIQHLQDKNCRLEKEKEVLADENCKLSETNKKLEKELHKKSEDFEVQDKIMTKAYVLLVEKIKSLEKDLKLKNTKLQYLQSLFVDERNEKDLISKVNGNSEGQITTISGIEKNKQLSSIKVEPEELCDSSFTQTKETETTCSTSKILQKKDIFGDNGTKEKTSQETQQQIETDVQDCRGTHTNNDEKFDCPICEKKFTSKNALNQHKNIHDKVHQCKTCLKCFQTKSKLVIHIRSHTGEKPYQCKTCGKKFARKDQLKNHEATHSDERNFKCRICPDGRSFKTKNCLSHHMVFHYEPRYLCSHCEKKFHTLSNLKNHLNFHYEPRYSCSHCEKKFHTLSNLKNHLNFHSEPRYSCSHCEKKFHTSSNLNNHMKYHHEPKYFCPKCGKKFYISTHLKRHVKSKIC